jgi:hypothetical protein
VMSVCVKRPPRPAAAAHPPARHRTRNRALPPPSRFR